jgi:hypothetical protein
MEMTENEAGEGPISKRDPAQPLKNVPASEQGAALFVWGVWAVVLLSCLAYVWKYSAGAMPVDDELPYVLESFTPRWLWAQHAEHRIPLPKLIWLSVLKLTSYDFRAGCLLDVLAMGVAAAAVILAVRAVRGWTSFPDAFFPLVLLSFRQAVNMLLWWQVNHALAPFLAILFLLIIVLKGVQLSFRFALLAGVLLILLSLSGPGGLPYVPLMALWLGYWGYLNWSSPAAHSRRNSALVWSLAAAAVLLVGFYFVGYTEDPSGSAWPYFRVEKNYTASGLWSALITSIDLLGLSLGAAVGFVPRAWGLAVLVLGLISIALLAVVRFTQAQERFRALGLLFFTGGAGALMLALGWARAPAPEEYLMVGHLQTKAVPGLCCVYFIWELYGRQTWSHVVHMCLFTATSLLFLTYVNQALEHGTARFKLAEAAEQDIQAGTTPMMMASRHRDAFTCEPQLSTDRLAAFLDDWRRAGIGRFKLLHPDPPMIEVSVPINPVFLNEMTWKDGIGRGTGNDPFMVLALPEAQLVYAIRITYAYPEATFFSPISFQVFWKRSDRQEFVEEERTQTQELRAATQDRTITIWVNDIIDQFRIDPDVKPCVIRIAKIELLVPAADRARVQRLDE